MLEHHLIKLVLRVVALIVNHSSMGWTASAALYHYTSTSHPKFVRLATKQKCSTRKQKNAWLILAKCTIQVASTEFLITREVLPTSRLIMIKRWWDVRSRPHFRMGINAWLVLCLAFIISRLINVSFVLLSLISTPILRVAYRRRPQVQAGTATSKKYRTSWGECHFITLVCWPVLKDLLTSMESHVLLVNSHPISIFRH